MKTNKLLHTFFLGCTFFVTATLSAQTLVTKWEAEDYTQNAFAGGGGSEPAIENMAAFSGGKVVRGISNSNFIVKNIYVNTAGTYELKIYYSYTKDEAAFQGGYITTRVNGQLKQTCAAKLTAQGTAVGDVIQMYSVLIYCEAGWNVIKIGQNGNGLYNPYIDKCELYTSTTTITKPDDDVAANSLATLYPVSFTTKNLYSWDFTNVAQSISLVEGTNATLPYLTDNDLSTSFVSDADSVEVLFNFKDSVVVRHLAMDSVLTLGSFRLQYLDGDTWKVIDRKSAYSNFADGALWHETKADKNNSTDWKLTLYKAPGAPQIKVADVLLVGYYYTKDTLNGGTSYPYMIDDLTSSENGAFVGCTKPADTYNTLTGFQTLDNARGSKYSVGATTFQIVYKFNTSASVNSFILANATGSTRDVKTFEIQGSNDSLIFTPLFRAENIQWKGRAYNFGGNITTPDYYKYYRFDMQANNGDTGYSEIGDLLLFGSLYSIPTDVNAPEAQSLVVFGANGNIVLRNAGAKSAFYQIFDVTGKLVKQGNISTSELNVPVAKGLYLVKSSVECMAPVTEKVAVK